MVAVTITNEGLRWPATAAGLWFLGLIGKTHETTDGRYQRGRLMGYLTANPGCHFRALMSALDMSNGQITHHLRILEAEEHVWRKETGDSFGSTLSPVNFIQTRTKRTSPSLPFRPTPRACRARS